MSKKISKPRMSGEDDSWDWVNQDTITSNLPKEWEKFAQDKWPYVIDPVEMPSPTRVHLTPVFEVLRIHENAKIPEFKHDSDAGADLCAIETVWIQPHSVQLIRTGLVIKPPSGYHLEIYIRSSVAVKNHGLVLANGIGLIDSSYCGPNDEIKVALLNMSNNDIHFQAGDRIAQLVAKKNNHIIYKEVKEIKNPSRGGFGSTGT